MTKNKGFSPVIILIAISILTLAVVAYYLGNRNNINPTPAPSGTPASSPSPTPADSWKNYHNSTWGFNLHFPSTWEGYFVSEHNWTNIPAHKITADICFYFKRSTAIPACIIQISIFSQQEWGESGEPAYLAKKDNFYFINDSPDQCVQLDDFQCARQKEVTDILSSFKLTQ